MHFTSYCFKATLKLPTNFKLSLSKGISITIFGIYLFFISKNCINHFCIAVFLYDNHFQFPLNYIPKYIWGSFSFFVFDQNWYGDHFPILIWGSFSDRAHFLVYPVVQFHEIFVRKQKLILFFHNNKNFVKSELKTASTKIFLLLLFFIAM